MKKIKCNKQAKLNYITYLKHTPYNSFSTPQNIGNKTQKKQVPKLGRYLNQTQSPKLGRYLNQVSISTWTKLFAFLKKKFPQVGAELSVIHCTLKMDEITSIVTSRIIMTQWLLL
jgi:hypothetical protein